MNHIFLQVDIQSIDINIPVEVNEPIAQTHHIPHSLGERFVQITGIEQKLKQISLNLRLAKVID